MSNCNCHNRRSGLNIRFSDDCGCNDTFAVFSGNNRSGCGCGCGCGRSTWSNNRCGCGCGTSWTSNRCWNRCRDCDCDCDNCW
ncbi:MAG: hypothetical protein Q4C46_03870 [Bacillota bacterium]|nr:hypothetical protein [Bacillota bacterium]